MIIVGNSVFFIIFCRLHKFLFLNYASIIPYRILFLINVSHSPRYALNVFISSSFPFI